MIHEMEDSPWEWKTTWLQYKIVHRVRHMTVTGKPPQTIPEGKKRYKQSKKKNSCKIRSQSEGEGESYWQPRTFPWESKETFEELTSEDEASKRKRTKLRNRRQLLGVQRRRREQKRAVCGGGGKPMVVDSSLKLKTPKKADPIWCCQNTNHANGP